VSPCGTFIVSASWDETVKVWDLAHGEEQMSLRGHTGPVFSCALSLDGTFIVSGGEDKTLRVWDAATGTERATLRGHTKEVKACAVTPDGIIVSASYDRTLRIWDPGTEDSFTLGRHEESIEGCAASPDSTFLLSASDDYTVKIWESGKPRVTLRGHTGNVTGCAVSPDGAFVASVSTDGTLRVWETRQGAEVAAISLPGWLYCVAFHPWMPLVVCGDGGGNLHVIDILGIELGPLIVTAVDGGAVGILRCPACFEQHPIERNQLGQVITCPGAGCETQLRINPFVLESPR